MHFVSEDYVSVGICGPRERERERARGFETIIGFE